MIEVASTLAVTDNTLELQRGIVNGIASSILPEKYKQNYHIKKIEEKKIIVCIHRDISKKDIDTLSLYGKVLFLEDFHQNIEPKFLFFDYLIIDLRNQVYRNYYKIHFYNNTNYYYILYRYWFETNNGIFYNNEITEFPSQQSSKINYLKLLLLEQIYEPKWYISLFRFCCLR